MERFFPIGGSPKIQETPQKGDSFLRGPYLCSHCHNQHGQWGRFTLNGQLSFCSPECAAGYNAHTCTDEHKMERHEQLEKIHKRRIQPAISYPQMKETGINRDAWLPYARRNLTIEERALVEREMKMI